VTTDFPLLDARTRRFTLGVPRDIGISPDGARVVFLRSRSGTDPVTCLWVIDVGSGEERLLVDPITLDVDEAALPPEERARRSGRGEAGGIVRWVADDTLTVVAFTLGGCSGARPRGRRGASAGDARGRRGARLSPDGQRIAYAVSGALRLHDIATGDDRALVEPDGLSRVGSRRVRGGEEMDRQRGFWWAPAVTPSSCSGPTSQVVRWHIGTPPIRRPAARGAVPRGRHAQRRGIAAPAGLDGSSVRCPSMTSISPR